MKYNKTERLVAKILTSFPSVKAKIKLAYQRVNYLRYRKKERFFSKSPIIPISNEKGEASFFGYYDHSPIDLGHTKILYYSSKTGTRKRPCPGDKLQIMLYNLETKKSKKLAETKAFNWQQGARMQWVDKDRFIYNDYEGAKDKFVSRILNIKTLEKKSFDYPVYDVFLDYGLGLNFDRLAHLRPDYGYFSRAQKKKMFDLNTEGVIYIDLLDNKAHLLISINRIIEVHYQKSMDNAEHLINHIMISPCGKKFMFIHRWFKNNVRYDALMLSDKNGNNISCLVDDGMVSHCCWKDSNEIVGYFRDKKLGDKYYLINIKTKIKSAIRKLDRFGDGHPHILKNIMITDTYPNKGRLKELLIYNFDDDSIEVIGEFFESFEYFGETRCDLHPRISGDGKLYFFDSVHSGKRQLYLMKSS